MTPTTSATMVRGVRPDKAMGLSCIRRNATTEEPDMIIKRQRRCLSVLVFALGTQTSHAQTSASPTLDNVQRLKCAFTLMAMGTWDNGVPRADVRPATLAMQFDDIDPQDGTATVADVSTVSAGAPHLTVRLLGDSLHFLAMNSSGAVYLTTVFSDRESRAGGKFKAVHTRHEFTQVMLVNYTSRPEQYYGYCEVVR